MEANTIDFNKVNISVCSVLSLDADKLYSSSKKSKAYANAFGHILYYLHVEKSVPVSALAKEYKRSRRLIFYHISRQKDFMRIYCTTRKEYDKILCALKTNE